MLKMRASGAGRDDAKIIRYRDAKLLTRCALRRQRIRAGGRFLLRFRPHGHVGKPNKYADQHKKEVDLHRFAGSAKILGE